MTGTSFNRIEPVISGRNSRIFRLEKRKENYALKFFRADADNARCRFVAETTAFKVFADHNIQYVPKMIAQDRENNCVVMKWIHGEKISFYRQDDVNKLTEFVGELNRISKKNCTGDIPFATEACLNGNDIVKQIKLRLECLELEGDTYPELQEFLDEDFSPVFKEIEEWSREEYHENSMDFDQEVSSEQITLSPVDIGFHNCLRIDNQIYFLDFEFFGWDDPVKLVADTLQHPGSVLKRKDNEQLLNGFHSIFNFDIQFQTRLKCLYPLFGLKWCMIMLNPFLSGYIFKNNLQKNSIRKEQLLRVKSKTALLVKTIENNLLK